VPRARDKESDAVAGAGPGEDRFEVVLNGVLGQGHLARQRAGVTAGGWQAEQLALAGAEPEGAAEEVKPVGGGASSIVTTMVAAAPPAAAACSVASRESMRPARFP